MANVLFVCLHKAGRSQVSQALFEHFAGPGHVARSAGTTPGERVHRGCRRDEVRKTRDDIHQGVEGLLSEPGTG